MSEFKNIFGPQVVPLKIFIPISPDGRAALALKCDHAITRLPFGPSATIGVPSLGIPETINVSCSAKEVKVALLDLFVFIRWLKEAVLIP